MKPSYSLLLDTHVIVWMSKYPDRLPRSLVQAIETTETRFVSHASAWEIQVKHQKHPAKFGFSLDHLEQAMKEFSCRELAIEYGDIRALNQLRFLHHDPFDQLLMSQASRRDLYLATLDRNIVKTFEAGRAFSLFTDRPHPS